MNFILKWLFHLSGWKIKGTVPDLPKMVVAVAPHTSSWDFIIGIMARSAMELKNTRFLGKKELFDGPFGFIFTSLGGVGVDRSSPHGLVNQVVEAFNRQERFILGIAPEGTRKKVDKLRSGFYQMARGAGVPILPVGFDFPTKSVIIGEPLVPGPDMDADLRVLMDFYRKIRGKIPELGL